MNWTQTSLNNVDIYAMAVYGNTILRVVISAVGDFGFLLTMVHHGRIEAKEVQMEFGLFASLTVIFCRNRWRRRY